MRVSAKQSRGPAEIAATGCRWSAILYLVCSLLTIFPATGCMYGSPFRYREWEDEERFGTTFSDRLKVVQGLSAQAESVSAAEREEISRDLARRISLESNELMRMELVRTLGAYRTDASYNALAQAANDPAPRVRRVACERLGNSGRPEAVAILSNALQTDSSGDVRMAATRSLGKLGDPKATTALARALDDGNPAMQRRAMESLASVSGQNLGENVAAWKNYTRNYLGEGQEAIATQSRPSQVQPAGGTY